MDPIAEIKDRLSIEDVVGRYVDLKRSGASYKGLCPFHGEKTPSFYVTPSRGTFHCFGCQRGGDIFEFVMEADKLPFVEALQVLAGQAGVSLPEKQQRQPSLKNKLFEANEEAAAFFGRALLEPQGTEARHYLLNRTFPEEARTRFHLGYAPEGRDALVRHLRGQGFDDRILLAAGLVVQDDIGGTVRDRFRGRLMFPIRDRSGHIVGFGGRILGDGQPKYLNSPQTEIFDKSSVLFGVNLAHEGIRHAGKAVLVEGYLDAIRAQIAGYSNTVASLGTAITVQQLSALARLTQTVVIALDPDPAGQAAAARTSLTALAEVTKAKGRATGAVGALDLRIARLPDGQGDPDELIRDNPALWEEVLNSSLPAFEFYVGSTLANLDHTSDGWKQEAIDRILPLIQQFGGSVGWQADWIQRLATETGVDPGILQRTMSAAQPGRRQSRPRKTDDESRNVTSSLTARTLTSDPAETTERALVSFLLKLVVVPDGAAEQLSDSTLGNHAHRTIVEELLLWRERANYDYEMFREHLPDDVRAVADELRELPGPPPEDGKVSLAVQLHLTRLRDIRLAHSRQRVAEMLKDLPSDRTALEGAADLHLETQEMEQILDDLSQQSARSSSGLS